MTPERWSRLTELFESAIEREPVERADFLAVACGSDHELRQEVDRLIDSHERAGDFGSSPVFRVAPAGTPSSDSAQTIEDTLDPGCRLGRYEVVTLLGSGGMGEVYRARDPQLGRDIALKVLRRRGEINSEQFKRFEREARAVAALNHPNILAVYDIGMAGGIPYVVSELLEGQTLRAALTEEVRLKPDATYSPLSVARSIDIALQIAAGLAAAHDKGIVHRDLKPENLFLTSDGLVKILDFGLAKQIDNNDASLTEHGFIIGTAGYMSPEQARGGNADARSDVFAFGAVLYEMLTGLRAFTGSSVVETMNAILTTEPASMSSLPAALAQIVQRCLEKDASRRAASIREIRVALEGAQRERASPSKGLSWPATWRSRGIVGSVAAALITAVAIGAAVTRDRNPPGPGASGRPAIAVMPLDDRSGDATLAWLSDGVSGMLVTALAQTPGLDVIGTERLEASFRELGRAPSDRSARVEVARHAGAGAVLVGTLLKAGSDVRLDVQVQDIDTGRVVVARSEQGTDLFAIVDAVAKDVRAALDVARGPAGRPLREVTTASLEAYALYVKAQQARHNNRWADARTLFEESLSADPSFTLARAQLVTILDRLGENANALAERRVVASQLNRLPERQRLLAEAVQKYDSDPSHALQLLEQLIDRYPDEEEAYDAIIHAYTHTRDPAYWKKALTFMQRWARAIPGPGSGHFHNHYGYAYIEHGLYTDAEREFRAYIRVSPDEANGYDSLAELFVLTGRPAMAIEQYDRALQLNPLFGWSHFGRAYALAMQGHYDDAFAGLTRLQTLGPSGGMPPVVIQLSSAIFYARTGRYEDAAKSLDEVRRLGRTQEDVGAELDAELFDALLAVERGHNARAVEYANRATRLETDVALDIMRARRSAVAHLIAGIAETRAGRIDAARERVATLRKLDANSDPIQRSWHQALTGEIALAERRLDAAEEAFRAAEYPIVSSFAIYPSAVVLANNLPFRDGLARTALARGDVARAIDVYRRLNEPDITSRWTAAFEPRFVLAVARLAARGADARTAQAEYERFLKLWKNADQGLPELAEARARRK